MDVDAFLRSGCVEDAHGGDGRRWSGGFSLVGFLQKEKGWRRR
jgi:hypothetical protein